MMVCENCGKETNSIHITADHEKVCSKMCGWILNAEYETQRLMEKASKMLRVEMAR